MASGQIFYHRNPGCQAQRDGYWPSRRERFRNAADEMERIAKFLRKPHPYRMPPYPRDTELAEMLDDAASYFRKAVEPSRNLPVY